jgi:tRNA(adenine34) deaminase
MLEAIRARRFRRDPPCCNPRARESPRRRYLMMTNALPSDDATGLHARLMTEALATARAGMAAGEAPIGCVLARGDGTIVSRAWNAMQRTENKTAHAEIMAFAEAAGQVPLDARDLIMVSTLEPCVMCTGAAMESAVATIVFGLAAPADSGTGRVRPPSSPESAMPAIVGGVRARESRALFVEWLATDPDPEQTKYVHQLLALTNEDGTPRHAHSAEHAS